MAAVSIPWPGTKLGPCVARREGPRAHGRPCEHRDCSEMRRLSAAGCVQCLSPIGYDTPYYMEGDQRVVHALCAEVAAEVDAARKRYGVELVPCGDTIASCDFCRGRNHSAYGKPAQFGPRDLWWLRAGVNTGMAHRTTACLPCLLQVAQLIGTVNSMVGRGLGKVVGL